METSFFQTPTPATRIARKSPNTSFNDVSQSTRPGSTPPSFTTSSGVNKRGQMGTTPNSSFINRSISQSGTNLFSSPDNVANIASTSTNTNTANTSSSISTSPAFLSTPSQQQKQSSQQSTPQQQTRRIHVSEEEARRAESARIGRRLQASLTIILVYCVSKIAKFSLTDFIEPFLSNAPVLASLYSFSRICIVTLIIYSFFSAAYFIIVGPSYKGSGGITIEVPQRASYTTPDLSQYSDNQYSSSPVRSSPKTRPSPAAPPSPSLHTYSPGRNSPSRTNMNSATKSRLSSFSPNKSFGTPSPDLRRTLFQNQSSFDAGQGLTNLDAYRSRHTPVASPDLHRSIADKLSSQSSSDF